MIDNTVVLTVLVSTLNEGIYNLEKTVSLKRPDLCYLIVHQTIKQIQTPEFLLREDIKVISSPTKGLSKSRNIAIKNCATEYALIADDDIEYIFEGIDEVINIIKSQKPDFATFKIKTPDFEPEYKKYCLESFRIGNKKNHFYSSVEILLNVKSLKKNHIYFDERFGLGTPLKSGEEEILINDLVANKLMGQYYPIYIVKHPHESSGKQKRSHNFKIFMKGALAARTNNYVYKSSSKHLFRKILDYSVYYYGILYINYKLPSFLIFIK